MDMLYYKGGPTCRVFDYALDKDRTMAYHDWIQANVNGKVVCELGAGSGIMVWLCLKYGATKVYCYENNFDILYHLEELFKDDDRVVIKNEDVSTATFPEADIYLHENIASNVFMENILDMYTNLKAQGLEDKTYPNKIKIQHGTYTGTSTNYPFRVDNFTNANVLEFFNKFNMNEIITDIFTYLEHDQSAITINGTSFDGYLKDLTRITEEDTNNEYIFWEASFDGNNTISNWKTKTHWNIIKAGDNHLAIPDDVTYNIA